MNIAVVNFNGGEFTGKIDARSDTEKYAGGCRQSDNMIPLIFGGSERRPGTEYITSDGAFSSMLTAIVAHENIVICWENTATVTNFDSVLSKITCHDNDVMCYENEVVSDDFLAFLSDALCYENNMVFCEGEAVYI